MAPQHRPPAPAGLARASSEDTPFRRAGADRRSPSMACSGVSRRPPNLYHDWELAKDFVVCGPAWESLYGASESMYKPDMVCYLLEIYMCYILLGQIPTTLVKAFGEHPGLRNLANLTLVMGNRDVIDEMSSTNGAVLTSVVKLIDKYDLYGQVAYPKHHKQSEVPDICCLAARTKIEYCWGGEGLRKTLIRWAAEKNSESGQEVVVEDAECSSTYCISFKVKNTEAVPPVKDL